MFINKTNYDENDVISILQSPMSVINEDNKKFLEDHIKYCKCMGYKYPDIKLAEYEPSNYLKLSSNDFMYEKHYTDKDLVIRFVDTNDVYAFGKCDAISFHDNGTAVSFGTGDAISKYGSAEARGDGNAFAYGFDDAKTYGRGHAISILLLSPIARDKVSIKGIYSLAETYGEGDAIVLDPNGETSEDILEPVEINLGALEATAYGDGDVKIYTLPIMYLDAFNKPTSNIQGYKGCVHGQAFGNGSVINHSDGDADTYKDGDALGFGRCSVWAHGDGDAVSVRGYRAVTFGKGAAINCCSHTLHYNEEDAEDYDGVGYAEACGTGDAYSFHGSAESHNGNSIGVYKNSHAYVTGSGSAIVLGLDGPSDFKEDIKDCSENCAVTFGTGDAFHFGGGHAMAKGNGSAYSHYEGDDLKGNELYNKNNRKIITKGIGDVVCVDTCLRGYADGIGHFITLKKPIKPFIVFKAENQMSTPSLYNTPNIKTIPHIKDYI